MMKEKITWIDTAKGIGILLVVLGHSMSPIMTGNTVMEKLYQFIYVFHMPLFFFLSGLLSRKFLISEHHIKKTLLISRCKRLMIPYAVWAVIYFPMKILMKEHVRFQQTNGLWTMLLGNNPAGQLWFLYVLFILSVLTILFVTKRNLPVFCIFGLIISILAPLIPSALSFPGISLSFSLYQVGFYFCGLLAAERTATFKGSRKIAAICSVVVLIYAVGIICNWEQWYLKAAAALGACYLVCFFAAKVSEPALGLSYLGSRSMIIYILHAPLFVAGRIFLKPLLEIHPWLYVIVLIVTAMGMSLISYEFSLKKVRIIRLLLFGES